MNGFKKVFSTKRNLKIKQHENNLKKLLEVDPIVLYGKKAREEMKRHAPKSYKWKKANGFYNPETNEIYIFKIVRLSECIIGTLAHEMRHAQQYNKYIRTKEKKFHFNEDTNWFVNDKDYSCRRSELDANRYAYRYCNKYCVGRMSVKYYLRKKNRWIKNRKKYKKKNGYLCL